MGFCVVREAISTIYERAGAEKEAGGQVISAIADEGLHGMLMEVTGDEEAGYLPVRTFYGYRGYILKEDVRLLDRWEAEGWEGSDLKVVGGGCVDVVSLPRVKACQPVPGKYCPGSGLEFGGSGMGQGVSGRWKNRVYEKSVPLG